MLWLIYSITYDHTSELNLYIKQQGIFSELQRRTTYVVVSI